MTRRRVMFVLPDLGLGGAQIVAARLAETLRDRGDVVVIATLGPTTNDHVSVPNGVRRFIVRPTDGRRGFVGVVTKNLRRARCLRRELRSASPDVVIAFVDSANLFTLIATRGLRTPVVVSERVDPREHSIAASQRLLRRLLYWRAQAVVVQTDRIAGWARWVVPRRRVHVIPNPVPLPPERSRPAEPLTILAIGRLVRQKGFDLLIDALAFVPPDVLSDWRIDILGEGECWEELEDLITRKGLEDQVRIRGRVDDVDVRLAAASMFVLSSRFEGFPNALAEAMSAGLATISFDCPTGPRELVESGVNGILVAPGDVRALGNAMVDVMTRPDLRERLGSEARKSMSRFDPDVIADEWDRLIEGVIAGVRHSGGR